MQLTVALAALDVSTLQSVTANSAAESFEAELMSMLHSAAEPFRVIFEALDAPTVQEPVSMAASMFEALDAATVQEVDFTAASILAALDASIENLSAVSVTSLVIRAALDAASLGLLCGDVRLFGVFRLGAGRDECTQRRHVAA